MSVPPRREGGRKPFEYRTEFVSKDEQTENMAFERRRRNNSR